MAQIFYQATDSLFIENSRHEIMLGQFHPLSLNNFERCPNRAVAVDS